MNENPLLIKEHLVELRKRVTWSVLAVIVSTGVAFAFHQQILSFLMEPAQGFADIPNQKPIYTELTEFIGAAFKASLVAGIAVSMPFVLYQMAMFVAPGLTPSEKRYLFALLPVSVLMFLAGATFGYLILFPPMLNFLLTFGSDVATPLIRIGSYVNTMVTLLFWMGVVFEIPLVSFFLSKIGVVTPEFLAKQRRYALVAAFVLGAIITPTFDPLNQTFVAVPIIVLYEAGIWLAKLARIGKKKPSSELGLADTDGGAQK